MTRLAQEVRDGHEEMPGLNVIRGAIDELCESGELVGRRESRGFIIRHPEGAIPLFGNRRKQTLQTGGLDDGYA
jgi:hypothetical protein